MKTAFLTEMGFSGKVPENHPNMRTEFAWMVTLQSDHYNLYQFNEVKGYDVVFIIFPKGIPKLNMVGCEMTMNSPDKDMGIYSTAIVDVLKSNNTKVCYVQEGCHEFFNDYQLDFQFHWHNQVASCDVIFAHNKYDMKFYAGMFPGVKVSHIPTLMIDTLIKDIIPTKENKAMIGGNFVRWYGGFQSYIVASEFDCPIYVPESHCKRKGEEQVPNLHHLKWVDWFGWMKQLSTFKYAVNMMPTIAAGTFSLNCAYFGIPCIGNEKVDTQRLCFPDLSVDVEDVLTAKTLAENIFTYNEEYSKISEQSIELCRESYHVDGKKWSDHINKIINE